MSDRNFAWINCPRPCVHILGALALSNITGFYMGSSEDLACLHDQVQILPASSWRGTSMNTLGLARLGQ